MLAEHGVDIEAGANVLGRINPADRDRAAAIAGVNLFEVGGTGRIHHCAGNRVTRHTAAEAVEAAGQLFFNAFTEEVDVGEDTARLAVLLLIADAGEQPIVANADLDLRTDLSGHRNRRIIVLGAFAKALEINRNLRTCARNFEHDADWLRAVLAWSGLRLLRLFLTFGLCFDLGCRRGALGTNGCGSRSWLYLGLRLGGCRLLGYGSGLLRFGGRLRRVVWLGLWLHLCVRLRLVDIA